MLATGSPLASLGFFGEFTSKTSFTSCPLNLTNKSNRKLDNRRESIESEVLEEYVASKGIFWIRHTDQSLREGSSVLPIDPEECTGLFIDAVNAR